VSSIADAGAVRSGPSSSANRLWLWGGLVSLLVAELVMLTLPFDPTAMEEGTWATFLGTFQRGIRPTFITVAVASVFFSWPVLQREFQRVLDESPDRIISPRWFAAHLMLLGMLVVGTRLLSIRLLSVSAWEGWLLLWILLSAGALTTWLFSALPPRFWFRWIARSRLPLIAAGIAGLAAYALGNWAQDLWAPERSLSLQRGSFYLVATILQLFGQLGVNRPDEMVIGTSRFVVTIMPHCSGLEGIGLICAFTGIYLWTCRRELSFPLALLLFPAGMISIWLLNSVRIAMLILIGGWDQDIALKGFHSAAGWIFFNMVAVGLVWTSSQSRLFIKAAAGDRADNPATKFLLPLIVFLTASLIARVLPPEFYLAITAIPVLAALWFCRSTLLSLEWKPSWFSALAGSAVFAVTASFSYETSAHAPVATAFAHLPITETLVLLALSLAGGAFAIPIAQELAFRGYLARKLIAPNFEQVPFEQFTWLSFVGSSIAFGILEPNWLVGLFAGMIFAAVMYRRGLLSDAIVAHLTSAGLLFALVATTGKWAFLGRL
jgi:exosortase E/protease (VPEID-CTERM system)